MTAPAHAPAITFLRRAGLFTAVLALMAGIFGMHVMTATHAMHSPAAAASAHHDSSPAGHTSEHLSGPVAAPELSAAQDEAGARTVQCTDSDNCPGMQSMTAACTPSAKTGSLAAPLPGTGLIGRTTTASTSLTTGARWSYFPESPSPAELCISRT